MSLKTLLRKTIWVKQEFWDESEIKVKRTLEKTKSDLTYALSQYEESLKSKHNAWEKYIEQLIDLWKYIDDDMAWKMINTGEEDLLVSKLENCRGLGFNTATYLLERHIDSVLSCMRTLNYGLIKKWEKETNYTKISVFGFDKDDYKGIILRCIDEGEWDRVICHINDFIISEQIYNENPSMYNFTIREAKPMFDVSYIEEILWKLLDDGDKIFDLALHLDKLQKYYHWLIDSEIALKLIKMGDKYVVMKVVKELSLFKSNKKLIYELVNMWYWEQIKAEWIYWFEWDEYKEVVCFLANNGVKL